jgi:hypothetical protein
LGSNRPGDELQNRQEIIEAILDRRASHGPRSLAAKPLDNERDVRPRILDALRLVDDGNGPGSSAGRKLAAGQQVRTQRLETGQENVRGATPSEPALVGGARWQDPAPNGGAADAIFSTWRDAHPSMIFMEGRYRASL